MHLTPSDDPMSIFVAGKLKPGRYKVQNLASQTYLEVLEPSKELCCRPASVLSPKDALVILEHNPVRRTVLMFLTLRFLQWDFQPSGSGYKIKKVRTSSYISSTHLVMMNSFERFGLLGRRRKTRTILQRAGRVRTLRIRWYSLCRRVPGIMEGRNRGRYSTPGIWIRSVSCHPPSERRRY